MATLETLRDDNLQTLPQDLTDQEAQEVAFNYEISDGIEKNVEKEIKETKKHFKNFVTNLVEDLKSMESIKGWGWAENFVNDLSNDVLKVFDDEICGFLSDVLVYEYVQEISEDKKQELGKEMVTIIDKISNIFNTYIEKIREMLEQGLQEQDNFKDVPEPTRSHLIKNKDAVKELVNNLGRWATFCLNVSELLKGNMKYNGLEIFEEIETGKIFDEKEIKDGLESMLENKPCELVDLMEDFVNLVCIEDLIGNLNLAGEEVTQRIKDTGKKIEGGTSRGDIKFDSDRYVISSWGKEVKVESIKSRGLMLEGLNLELGDTDGMWLANFKNWIKYKYGNKEVKYGIPEGKLPQIFNHGKEKISTFYIDNTVIIKKSSLKKYFNIDLYGEENDVMKKICEWLNK